MSTAEWRFEVRIQLTERLTDAQLNDLMTGAVEAHWDVTRDPVDVLFARDPIGIALITYGPAREPAEGLKILWSMAAQWLAAEGRTGYVVAGEVLTAEMHEARPPRADLPDLLAATDVAELLGVSRQRVHQLHTEREDFPAPYARLGSGPIWTKPAIEGFDRRWTRRPGRPARTR